MNTLRLGTVVLKFCLEVFALLVKGRVSSSKVRVFLRIELSSSGFNLLLLLPCMFKNEPLGDLSLQHRDGLAEPSFVNSSIILILVSASAVPAAPSELRMNSDCSMFTLPFFSLAFF
jgi:hypothetical protein